MKKNDKVLITLHEKIISFTDCVPLIFVFFMRKLNILEISKARTIILAPFLDFTMLFVQQYILRLLF